MFFHLVGFASLFGVADVQVRQHERFAKNGMMHGALTQLVTGPILAAVSWRQVSHGAVALKLAIVLIILGILTFYRRDPARRIPPKPFFTVFGLTFLEVVIAITWLHA